MISGLPEIYIPEEVCEKCVQKKQHKNSFSKDERSKSKVTLNIIYSYVCSPLQIYSLGGNKYFVTLIYDYNRKMWTYLIKKKSDVTDVFTKFKVMVERNSDHKSKVSRM